MAEEVLELDVIPSRASKTSAGSRPVEVIPLPSGRGDIYVVNGRPVHVPAPLTRLTRETRDSSKPSKPSKTSKSE